MPVQRTVSPIDGRLVAERELADAAAVARALERAGAAFPRWRATPVAERCALLSRAVDALVARRDAIAREITLQIGRPIAHSPGELRGFAERARHMLELAPEALADVELGAQARLHAASSAASRSASCSSLAPWNYPYLTAVNAIVPALLAGNAVILKHSAQTPLVRRALRRGVREAGLPEGVFQHLHLRTSDAARIIASGARRLRRVHRLGRGRPRGAGAPRASASSATDLELGGKDPAYVRADADLAHAVENLVDGAFFNSGQSLLRHRAHLRARATSTTRFVEGFVDARRAATCSATRSTPTTTLGPMVRTSAADFVRGAGRRGRRARARAP